MPSCREKYRKFELINTDEEYAKLFAMIARDRPTEWTVIPSGANGWDQSARRWRPGVGAAIEEQRWDYAKPLLEECIQNAARLEREPERYKCTNTAQFWFPQNRGHNLRASVLAQWLLGRRLDRTTLALGARLLGQWATTTGHPELRRRDSMVMGMLMQAIRLALIAGDVAYARELLAKKYTMMWWWIDEKDLWMRLLAEHPAVRLETRARCEELFDIIRDPDVLNTPYPGSKNFTYLSVGAGGIEHALEFALVRQMYLVEREPSQTPDVQAVINAITA